MQYNSKASLVDTESLANELDLLATVHPSDGSFASCYLDTRGGQSQGLAFLSAKSEAIGSQLHGTARFDFDSALEMVKRQVRESWHPGVEGVAIFARSIVGGK